MVTLISVRVLCVYRCVCVRVKISRKHRSMLIGADQRHLLAICDNRYRAHHRCTTESSQNTELDDRNKKRESRHKRAENIYTHTQARAKKRGGGELIS